MWAKQSTAATLIVGPILDSTGAEYTSAVIGDLSLSKNGGTLTALAAAATLTHIANGQYTLVTTTGNLDTLGRAQITCNKSTYQMPPVNLMVVPAMVFDSMVLGTDDLDTNAKKWNDLSTVALPLVPTVAGRTLNVSAGGLGDAVLDTAGQQMVTAFNAMRVGNVFTAPALANAPAGSGGGGDNTEVLEAIDAMKSIISEWIALNIPSDVRGFPATIIGGTDIGVALEIVDSANDPITEIFGESVETVQWLFGMGTSARRARILGSVEWIADLLKITIDRTDTLTEEDGARTWMIGVKLTSGEIKWVKTGVTRLIGRQFAEPTTTTTGA